MRASPENANKIVNFLRQFRDTIKQDAELFKAWKERIGKNAQ
jgi:hypothetical protein